MENKSTYLVLQNNAVGKNFLDNLFARISTSSTNLSVYIFLLICSLIPCAFCWVQWKIIGLALGLGPIALLFGCLAIYSLYRSEFNKEHPQKVHNSIKVIHFWLGAGNAVAYIFFAPANYDPAPIVTIVKLLILFVTGIWAVHHFLKSKNNTI